MRMSSCVHVVELPITIGEHSYCVACCNTPCDRLLMTSRRCRSLQLAAVDDPSPEDWLSMSCLRTVAAADNPFVPGMTLSVMLSARTEIAPEGEKRMLISLRDRIDALLLEVLERLPKTVRGFPGGMEGCAAIFEPEGREQDPRYLPGPLAVVLQKRRQMEVFCAAPLVMDFLSLVFKKGLPDLRDTNGLRGNREELKYLCGTGHESLVIHQSRVLHDDEGGSFLQGTDTELGTMTVLPGAQFIAAGVVAKPCSYYRVPAMRMALDFSVYVGMLAFFCTFVLLFEDGESIDEEGAIIYEDVAITWGEIVFALYVVAGIWTEICEIWRGLGEYMEDGWNVLDILGLAVSLGGFGVRCFDPTCPWGRSLYALSAPLLVSRILFFAQVLPFQGPMVQVLFLMMREMFRFAVVLLVVMLGFTLSFHAFFRTDDTYGRTCLNLFKAMLGEVGFFDEISEDRYESRYKSVAMALLVVYLILITVVLLNLLIAVLSTSHAKVQEHADQEYKVLKARLIKHYRFVVQNDLLPAPFNLVQLPFRRHEGAKRRVGYVVFWLVAGPVAVVGGALLWVVSAFLLPWETENARLFRCCERVSVVVEHLKLYVWRIVGCPLHLFGWWLTQPFVCIWFLVSGSWGGSELDNAEGRRRPARRVDEILDAEDEPSVKELLRFLVDPLSDDKVREDERKKATTVEHMKLLRNRLENQNKLLQDHIDGTINRKMDVLHKAMDERMDVLVKLVSQQGNQEEELSA